MPKNGEKEKSMKKRVVLGFVSAALAAVMCLGFAGCGGSNAESVKGKEVTEKQWNAAIEFFLKTDAKYTISYSRERTSEMKFEYLDEKLSGSTTVVKNNAKEYVKQADKIKISGDMKKIAAALDDEVETVDTVEEQYAVYKGTTYTVYTQDDDETWVTNERSGSIIPFSLVTSGVSLSYSSYEYSKDLNGYVPKDAIQDGDMYVVKFNGDGKLCAIYYNYERSTKSGNYENKYRQTLNIVIRYKEEKITLPTVG